MTVVQYIDQTYFLLSQNLSGNRINICHDKNTLHPCQLNTNYLDTNRNTLDHYKWHNRRNMARIALWHHLHKIHRDI